MKVQLLVYVCQGMVLWPITNNLAQVERFLDLIRMNDSIQRLVHAPIRSEPLKRELGLRLKTLQCI